MRNDVVETVYSALALALAFAGSLMAMAAVATVARAALLWMGAL